MFSIQERLGLHTEAIEGALYQWACAMRSSIPAIVTSFNPDKQTVTAQIAIQEWILGPPPPTPGNLTPDQTQNIPIAVSIKPIEEIPIVMMRVPGWSITLPITVGTPCLLIFSDMCIDHWWETGNVSTQADRRRHDLSDAIAIFGPWSQQAKLSNYSTDSLQIRSDDGTVVIDLSDGLITVQAPSVQVLEQGGVAIPLVNQHLITWIAGTLIPALAAKGITVAPPPVNCVTTVLEGQ